jgi:Anti-sigma-K factor rskA, C-terminal
MTNEHDVLHDLLAPVALGAAEPSEIARVEAHAADCPICREELAGLRNAAGVLAVAVPQEEPPPALKGSIMQIVRAEAAERAVREEPAPAPAPARQPRRARWRPGLRPWPALAALAAVAALLLAWNIALQVGDDGGGGPEVAVLPVTGTAAAPDVSGRMIYVPSEDTAVMRLERLPALDPGDAYQLWVLRDGRARSAGLFEPTGPAQAQGVAAGVAGADGLAVTAQPATSRDVPQGPILVQSPLSAG